MKRLFPVALLMIFSIGLNAQEVQIEMEKGFEYYSMSTKGEDGYVCKVKTDYPISMENYTKYYYYDTEMNLVKQEVFYLDKRSYKMKTINTGEYYQQYFQKGGNIIIRSDALKSFDDYTIEVPLPVKRFTVGDVIVSDDISWIIPARSTEWGVFKLNWKNGESEFYPVEIEGAENLKINGFKLVGSERLMVLVSVETGKNEYDQYAIEFLKTGEKVGSYLLTHKKILNMKIAETTEGEYLFAGTYSNKSNFKSDGIFIAKLDNGEIVAEQLINYNEIPNFSENNEGYGDKGNYVTMDITSTGGGFFVIGEIYFSVKHRTNSQDFTSIVFDYNQFTHGFVCVFDTEGKLSWATSFKNYFKSYSANVSKTSIYVSEVDSETYNFRDSESDQYFQLDLMDESLSIISVEDVKISEQDVKSPNNNYSFSHSQENVKTANGKKMILLTITRTFDDN